MTQLSSRSSSRLYEGLTTLYELAPLEEFPHRVLTLMHLLIGCDAASYNDIEVSTGQYRVLVDPQDSISEIVNPGFEQFIHEHPVIAHVHASGDQRALAISDFLEPTQFRRLGLYGEFFGPLGFRDQLSVTLFVAHGKRILGVALNRSGNFTEQDRLVLDTLRPHLVVAYQNAILFSKCLRQSVVDGPFSALAMTSLDLLTDRQREVLRLVSLGYANYKVANELDIRVGTVKKHIEHILERLEVRSRVGAARIYIAGTQLRDNSEWWNVVGDADHKLFSP